MSFPDCAGLNIDTTASFADDCNSAITILYACT